MYKIKTLPSLRWLPLLLLATAIIAGTPQARAQMTGEFSTDAGIISSALRATVTATGKADAGASRLAMEELYRQWRSFRARNFATPGLDPQAVPEMEQVEARLYAASLLVDQGDYAGAHKTLQTAAAVLQDVRRRVASAGQPVVH